VDLAPERASSTAPGYCTRQIQRHDSQSLIVGVKSLHAPLFGIMASVSNPPSNPSAINPSDDAAHAVVPVELSILGARVRGQARVPIAPTSTKDMLPAFRLVADAVVRLTVLSAEQHSGKISCTKGCGACCRQAVPIAHSEAYRLREVVEAMPEPRRSIILARFAEAERRVREAGLFDRLAEPERFTREELEPTPMQYFDLQIPCPFLEEESCSIYDERPLACREYLVTSPAAYCSRPDDRVVAVCPPLKPSEALARLDGIEGVKFVKRMLLTLSLWFAREHAEAPPPDSHTGPAVLNEFLEHLERTRETQAARVTNI